MIIHINNLLVKVSIGITEAEKAILQPLIIHVALTVDACKAIQTDNVMHTVSYSDLQKSIQHLASTKVYNLLETLAYAIAGICFQQEISESVHISIRKPYILSDSKSAGVDLTIHKHEYSIPKSW